MGWIGPVGVGEPTGPLLHDALVTFAVYVCSR
jgi:hypothetical protein